MALLRERTRHIREQLPGRSRVGSEELVEEQNLHRGTCQTSANARLLSLAREFSDFRSKYGPAASTSIRVRRKQSIACAGVFTTGSFSLKDVFSRTGTPVRSAKRRINFQYTGLMSRSTLCSRPVPSAWTTAGIRAWCSGLIR